MVVTRVEAGNSMSFRETLKCLRRAADITHRIGDRVRPEDAKAASEVTDAAMFRVA